MIRVAEINDLDAVYEQIKQLSNHEFTKEAFHDCYLYNQKNGHILVYEEEQIICGCIVFTIHYHLHFSRKTVEIVNLIVDSRYRSSGIGQQLLAAVEIIANESGCACIEAASGKQRKRAHHFYEREGFVCGHYKFTKKLAAFKENVC